MSKLEEAIERLQHNKNMPLHGGESVIVSIDDLETVLEELNNSIPKQYIQEKIDWLNEE